MGWLYNVVADCKEVGSNSCCCQVSDDTLVGDQVGRAEPSVDCQRPAAK